MNKSDFVAAFTSLGQNIRKPLRLTLVGGSALAILELVQRQTKDADVIEASAKLSSIRKEIETVAKELDIGTDWLNEDASAWRKFLPPDYPNRLVVVGQFGNLTVNSLGRQDLILMKIIAGRNRDLLDLKELAVRAEELYFVRQQVERLKRIDQETGTFVEDYLDLLEAQIPAKPAKHNRGLHG